MALAPPQTTGLTVSEEVAIRADGRRIRTILVTDIIDSTRTAERVGDRAWSELLAAHDSVVREELGRAGGEEVDTAGDGFLIFFDGPARAIGCALAIHDRLEPLGLSIRAGVHTGEVEEADGRASGIAIHVASRIAERAAAGEVLVGTTTRELAAGSGLVFADRGEHVMKGVSEPRRLYAALPDPVGAEGAGRTGGGGRVPRRAQCPGGRRAPSRRRRALGRGSSRAARAQRSHRERPPAVDLSQAGRAVHARRPAVLPSKTASSDD